MFSKKNEERNRGDPRRKGKVETRKVDKYENRGAGHGYSGECRLDNGWDADKMWRGCSRKSYVRMTIRGERRRKETIVS